MSKEEQVHCSNSKDVWIIIVINFLFLSAYSTWEYRYNTTCKFWVCNDKVSIKIKSGMSTEVFRERVSETLKNPEISRTPWTAWKYYFAKNMGYFSIPQNLALFINFRHSRKVANGTRVFGRVWINLSYVPKIQLFGTSF